MFTSVSSFFKYQNQSIVITADALPKPVYSYYAVDVFYTQPVYSHYAIDVLYHNQSIATTL